MSWTIAAPAVGTLVGVAAICWWGRRIQAWVMHTSAAVTSLAAQTRPRPEPGPLECRAGERRRRRAAVWCRLHVPGASLLVGAWAKLRRKHAAAATVGALGATAVAAAAAMGVALAPGPGPSTGLSAPGGPVVEPVEPERFPQDGVLVVSERLKGDDWDGSTARAPGTFLPASEQSDVADPPGYDDAADVQAQASTPNPETGRGPDEAAVVPPATTTTAPGGSIAGPTTTTVPDERDDPPTTTTTVPAPPDDPDEREEWCLLQLDLLRLIDLGICA